jgi:hypothetical protein
VTYGFGTGPIDPPTATFELSKTGIRPKMVLSIHENSNRGNLSRLLALKVCLEIDFFEEY